MTLTNDVAPPVHVGWIDKCGHENPFPRELDLPVALKQVKQLNEIELKHAGRAPHISGTVCWFALVGDLTCPVRCACCQGKPHHWMPDDEVRHGVKWMTCKHCPASRTRVGMDDGEGGNSERARVASEDE